MASPRTCCSVENGSFALGIISSILSCLTILASIAFIFVISFDKSFSQDGLGKAVSAMYLIVLVAFFMISLANLMFSVVLIQGVIKKNATYVMMYFVYGIILLVLSVIITLAVSAVAEFDSEVLPIFWGIDVVYIVIHSLLLYMVHKMYKKFKTIINDENNHKNAAAI